MTATNVGRILKSSCVRQDFFFWLTVVYLFIVIAKPHEVYIILANIRLERILMIFLLLCSFFQSDRRLRFGSTSTCVIVFTLCLFVSTIFAISPTLSWEVFYNYLKLVVFYFVTVYCINSVYMLKSFVLCFVLISFVYMALSFREFLLGQHVYDMGVIRMISWSGSASPNSFGVFCSCFLPYAVLFTNKQFITPLSWGAISVVPKKIIQLIIKLYFPLACICILLTNSRTSFLLLLIFSFILFLRTKNRLLVLVMVLIISAIAYQYLPEESKHRYMSILYTAGLAERDETMSRVDESAEASAMGRIGGMMGGISVFIEHPLTGVGPGGYAEYSGVGFQTHSLVGQVLSEVGLIGTVSFIFLLFSFFRNSRTLRKKIIHQNKMDISIDILFAKKLNTAVLDSTFILLVGSFFGHTLFQPWWLYIAAFTSMNSQLYLEYQVD